MNIIKSAKMSRFLLKSVRDFNEFHTPRLLAIGLGDLHSEEVGKDCFSIVSQCTYAITSCILSYKNKTQTLRMWSENF